MRLDIKNRHERTREGIKYCEQCGRVLNTLYKEDICPECQEINLFAEVKEYIRSNDVREADVAEHFNIPIRKVRDWIKQGRIEYKDNGESSVRSVHCQMCGKPMDFGSLCPECRKLQGLQVVAKKYGDAQEAGMRFLGKNKDGQTF